VYLFPGPPPPQAPADDVLFSLLGIRGCPSGKKSLRFRCLSFPPRFADISSAVRIGPPFFLLREIEPARSDRRAICGPVWTVFFSFFFFFLLLFPALKEGQPRIHRQSFKVPRVRVELGRWKRPSPFFPLRLSYNCGRTKTVFPKWSPLSFLIESSFFCPPPSSSFSSGRV